VCPMLSRLQTGERKNQRMAKGNAPAVGTAAVAPTVRGGKD
jgi:hypothetical protein